MRKIKTLEKNIATNDTKKLVIYNNWNIYKDIKINIILEIQRMKLFLT